VQKTEQKFQIIRTG